LGIDVKKFEKKVLFKFTFIYFLSIAFFVVVIGYLYFNQQKTFIIQKNTMQMHNFLIKLKQSHFTYQDQNYQAKKCKKDSLKYKLASKNGLYYEKAFPLKMGQECILVKLKSSVVDNEIEKLKRFVILFQIGLLGIFLLISFVLAKISIKPIKDTISHMDRFTKDLIHDLNTPSTAILLNIKLLENKIQDNNILKSLQRIKSSAQNISSLYNNLEIVLQKKFKKQKFDLKLIVEEKIQNFKLQHPDIKFIFHAESLFVVTDKKSVERIVDNILSNSCKYSNKTKPIVEIFIKNNTLIIKDNGKGIKYPNKVFERSYSENDNGHGIGMHIVWRLCEELDIKITINSQYEKGTVIKLKLKSLAILT
jgi:two-component system OmpR family sensor kinase